MLFLFRGRHGSLVRAILGAILLVAGILLHGGAILVGIGAVLLVWAGVGALNGLRARRQAQLYAGGQMR